MLQDSHLHLSDIHDIRVTGAILAQAREHGVGRLAPNATYPADWDTIENFVVQSPAVVPFFGVHPWFINKTEPGWDDRLKERLLRTRSGVGEIGLDRAKAWLDFEKQKEVFTRQIDLALEFKRPVAVHCVDAWGTLLEIFRARPMNNIPFMIHLFAGSIEVLTELLAMGAYISFSLGIAPDGHEKVGHAFDETPLDRLLLETDYPYARAAHEKTPASAEAYFAKLKAVYQTAALRRGKSIQEIENIVWNNGSIFMPQAASGR